MDVCHKQSTAQRIENNFVMRQHQDAKSRLNFVSRTMRRQQIQVLATFISILITCFTPFKLNKSQPERSFIKQKDQFI